VRYVSSEHFTNDLINAIRTHTTVEFRERYRSLDMLLIDDIQFIAGKESTQEEFFHTFNALHDSGWQIVITSDRPPRAITTLEDRLRSRFEGGLIADIQPPPLETRIAILRFKAETQPIPVPNEVIDLIAQQVQSNVRELEGSLNRVVAQAVLMQLPLTSELALAALEDYVPHKGSFVPQYVIEQVSKFYDVDTEDITGRSRNKKVMRPRQVCMYLAREETRASLPQIGRALGNRDHSTVLHGYEKIANLIEEDQQLRRDIMAIRERLYGNGKWPHG
jgi:chromosomal replication initiator protein